MNQGAALGRSPVRIEDGLLAVLGLTAGPLLWWMGTAWQADLATSAVQTLEAWIGLGCALIGVLLTAIWALVSLAGVVLAIGLKTGNAAVTYWSQLVTPKFLRRLIISALGAQLALASQAVAAPTDTDSSFAPATDHPGAPFMPQVISEDVTSFPSTLDQPTDTDGESAKTRSASSPSPRPTAPPQQESTATPWSTVSPEPRHTSQITVEPRITSSVDLPLNSAPRGATSPEASPDTKSTQQGFLPRPSPAAPAPAPRETTSGQQQNTVVVKRGDCLWDIAHHELGADATLVQIDQRWRQWWEHNRSIIGDDPHTIKPGTILTTPPFRS